ncbi:MAG: Rrf2 family transcriptional regulator [Planctomycetaceae bacterium]|nr:Rrf2 family transcriptional regulator [Planctomycetaceae bacterium]
MISKTGKYGIRAMLVLARLPADEYAGTPQIAELASIPPSYLRKLFQTLAKSGLVKSQRGIAGGFRLARDANLITVYDILAALEPIDRWSECFLDNTECSEDQACSIHSHWKAVQEAYLKMLRQSTLSELATRVSLQRQLCDQPP